MWWEGLQGTSPVFLPENNFGGSERAVTSVNAPVERRELQVQPLLKPATAWWRNLHKSARDFLLRFNFEGSEFMVTSDKRASVSRFKPGKPMDGFLPRLNLRVVSLQLLLTEMSVVRSHLRFGA